MPTYRAPGRVNLIGEHTDYSGGLVLPAAIDRATTLEVTEVGGDVVSLTSLTHPGTAVVELDGSLREGPAWGRYAAAVVAELRDAGIVVPGFVGTIDSDLPDGAGLSSSHALEVLIAITCLDLAEADMDAREVARLTQRSEHRAVGVRTGIMDQAAILLGRAGRAIFLDTETLDHELVPLPRGLQILVVDSGVRRQLEHSGYGQRRDELESAIRHLGGRTIRELRPDDLPALLAELDDVPGRRLAHVVTENQRVREVRDLLVDPPAGTDVPARLGELFAAGHASMRDDFEASHPALDLLVTEAVAGGAVAARMTGGGFGGAIVVLVDEDEADRLGAQLVAHGARHDLDVTVHATSAADGAGRVA